MRGGEEGERGSGDRGRLGGEEGERVRGVRRHVPARRPEHVVLLGAG